MQIARNCKAALALRPPAQMVKAMKLTAFLLMAFLLQVSAKTFSQKVTVDLQNVSADKVFREIKKQTGFLFLYNSTELKKLGRVSVYVRNAPVEVVLDQCFASGNYTYRIVDKTIVITARPAAPVAAAPVADAPAAVDIKGIVTDETNTPLAGASVKIKGTSQGAITGADGRFTLRAVAVPFSVVVSFIGYEQKEQSVTSGAYLAIHLKHTENPLDGLVVIGYGTTSRRMNTGSVSSITAADIDKQTVTNPLTALQGRIPGMQITQDNGLPGGAVRVNIRGSATSSFYNSGFIPLYVVDGVPFTLFNGGQPATDNLNAFGASGANGGLSPFAMINPDDIERIDVLKDADATAIYGSRGANGVVLITTKKGTRKGSSLNFKVNQGFSKVPHFINMMNTQQYLAMRKEAYANTGATPTGLDLTTWDQNAYTDWQRWAIGGTAHLTNAGATYSAGDQQNTILFSSTYRREGTVYQGNYTNNNFSSRLSAGHTSID
ncbi:MAG: TonB-dependent receptor plug domain-containing protein, partial [Bacteroidetes bacterium]|nr:TonB-dependent receptor plug domain-containing protein [Bacteroidota bacterium]